MGGTPTFDVLESPPPCPSPTRGEGTLWRPPRFISKPVLLGTVRATFVVIAFLLCLAVGTIAWVWVRLEPLSPTEFQLESGERTRLAFTLDSAGKVSGAILNPGPPQVSGIKLD